MSRPCVIEPQIGRMGSVFWGKSAAVTSPPGNAAVRLFGLALPTVSTAARPESSCDFLTLG
jgi:hypothetical protein